MWRPSTIFKFTRASAIAEGPRVSGILYWNVSNSDTDVISVMSSLS